VFSKNLVICRSESDFIGSLKYVIK